MTLHFSFIIPVYNRPDEMEELLDSLSKQTYDKPFEVVVVEDGSTMSSKHIIERYANKLAISYYEKPNSGPGASRNYGMLRAKGNYNIILDSDCIIPSGYLAIVDKELTDNYVDCFGGPDAAHDSFTAIQKAINFVMTSFVTTGGIRGGKKSTTKFQPRSFNMGISKKAFLATGGFGRIHPGEDPDLTIRLWKSGFETALITEAFVYHKRRIAWQQFYTQVTKFGKCRPILNLWHPDTKKITYWFPSVFVLGVLVALMFSMFGMYHLLALVFLYLFIVLLSALISTKNIKVMALVLVALGIQFFGYGVGFMVSTFKLNVLKKDPEVAFPKLFFKKS